MVTTPGGAPLLAGNADVRRVIVYDKHGADKGIRAVFRMAGRVPAQPGDAAYLAQGSPRSAFLALIAGYRQRIGFNTSAGAMTYTQRIRHRANQHHAERLLRLALGNDAHIDSSDITPSLFPSSEDRTAVDRLLSTHSARDERFIALAPGSVWATKRWPGFPSLAQSLSRHGRIVIIGGPGERELARSIMTAVPAAIDATGGLSVLASAELIRRSALLVTNDSLPQHLASAMGTPTVTIYGPTIEGFGFGPLAPHSTAVGHQFLSCRPCHPHGPAVCPLGHHKCMRELDANTVLARALHTLAA